MQVWPMRPLLEDDSGKPITTVDAWHARAAALRATIVPTFGTPPDTHSLRGFEVGKPQPDNDVIRTLVRITVDEDDVMEAWLLEPMVPRAIRRVALAPHQTTPHGKDEVVGLEGRPSRAYGLHLARRGWTVLAPDQLALKNRYAKELPAYDTAHFYERFPNWSAVGKMLVDHQIAIDVLERLPQTRGCAVHCIGHSLGAHTAGLLAAFDTRVARTVANAGLFPFASSKHRDAWFREQWYIYLKDPALKKSVLEGPQPLWDWHEMCALIAPRPLMIVNSPADELSKDLEGTLTMVSELYKVYDLLGVPENFCAILHGEGHTLNRWQRDYAYAWLEQDAEA